MEVGDYVRYKYENYIYIGKIKFISEVMSGLDETLQLDIDNCMEEILKEDVIKSRPKEKIIELIEIGDYVNGCKIIDICIDEITNLKYLETDITEFDNVYACGHINIYENDIKSIVTKEQFKNMEYEVK